jgi:hypothetical protein
MNYDLNDSLTSSIGTSEQISSDFLTSKLRITITDKLLPISDTRVKPKAAERRSADRLPSLFLRVMLYAVCLSVERR